MDRKLVTIRQVAETRPIAGSQQMEIAVIEGWTCAVRVGEFQKGELVLFFEIDSFLPPHTVDARYSPARNPMHHSISTWNGQKGIHVKSIMVNNSVEISQGVVLKLEAFPEIQNVHIALINELGLTVGEEKAMAICFAEELGVKKWQLSEAEAGASLGQPPVCFPKTDIERVQNIKTLFGPKYSKATFQESVKMDGSSMTVYYIKKDSQYYRSLPTLGEGVDADMKHGRVGVCSRKHDLNKNGGGKFWEMALKYELPRKLEKVGRNVAIQGELVGSTICQNRHGFDKGEHDFFVYSIFDMDTQQYLHPREVEQRVSQLALKHVPVLGYVNIQGIAKDCKGLLERAEGTGINGKKREGLVYKNVRDGRWFKVIANNYLLKHGE